MVGFNRAGYWPACLAAVLLLAGTARAQAPAEWVVDASAFPSTMSVIATLTVDGSALTSGDAVLAALSDGTVRGVAPAATFGGLTVFFLTIHGSGGEPITFEAYTGAEGSAPVAIGPGLTYEPNAILGTQGSPTPLLSDTLPAPSTWVVNPAAFAHSCTLIAAVEVDGDRVEHPGAVLAAFVGSEVRGVASMSIQDGAALFFLTLYGDVSASVDFQVFNPSTSSEPSAVGPALAYVPESSWGALASPVMLASGAPVSLPAGWAFDPFAYESNMNLIVRVDAPAVTAGSVLGAFSGETARGTATATMVGADPLFFLTLYGDGAAPLDFRFLDGITGEIAEVRPGVTFSANAILGSVGDPFVVSSAPEIVVPTGWTVDAGAYAESMTVVLTVQAGEGEGAGVLAAYAGQELRGVATSTRQGSRLVFVITIYGEAPTEITFAYTTGTGDSAPVPVESGVAFVANSFVGSVSQPYVVRPPAGSCQFPARLGLGHGPCGRGNGSRNDRRFCMVLRRDRHRLSYPGLGRL
ncbi:MAG: hypothetical protein ACI80V_003085 [Rhodothermales bacterium]|jgi:hypothetical protein